MAHETTYRAADENGRPGGPGGEVVLGLDVGGTVIKSALVSPDGTVHDESRRPTPAAEGPDAALAAVLEHAADAVARAADAGVQVRAAGIATCGLTDEETGTVLFSSFLRWRDLPLRRLAAERLGLPVALGHDVRTGGLAEARLGAGRGHQVVFFVPIGTGVGGALLLDGRPFPGGHWRSAELGHMVLDPGGEPCLCGQRGCLSLVAGGVGIARRYARRAHPPAGAAEVDAAEVARRAATGDPVAAEVWDEAVDALAHGLLHVMALIDPGVVILGGGVSQAGEQLAGPLRRNLERRASFHALPEIAFARLGERAGRIGAGLLAWDLLGAAARS